MFSLLMLVFLRFSNPNPCHGLVPWLVSSSVFLFFSCTNLFFYYILAIAYLIY